MVLLVLTFQGTMIISKSIEFDLLEINPFVFGVYPKIFFLKKDYFVIRETIPKAAFTIPLGFQYLSPL